MSQSFNRLKELIIARKPDGFDEAQSIIFERIWRQEIEPIILRHARKKLDPSTLEKPEDIVSIVAVKMIDALIYHFNERDPNSWFCRATSGDFASFKMYVRYLSGDRVRTVNRPVWKTGQQSPLMSCEGSSQEQSGNIEFQDQDLYHEQEFEEENEDRYRHQMIFQAWNNLDDPRHRFVLGAMYGVGSYPVNREGVLKLATECGLVINEAFRFSQKSRWSIADVAEILGVNPRTVSRYLQEAKKTLKKLC